MCDDCGCGQPPEAVTYRKPGEADHHHDHGHDPGHHHHHPQPGNGSRTLQVETDVLQQNNLLAQRNRGWFDAGFAPATIARSVWSRSSRVTVAVPLPSIRFRATPEALWQ
jgi:hypothetical protein